MLTGLHLPQLRELRRWPTLSTHETVAMALILFAAVFGLRLADTNVGDAEGVLYITPIGVIALRFGLRGALVGALFALGLVVAWGGLTGDVHLLTVGYLTRALALVGVAIIMGTFVEHRRRLEAGIVHYYDATLDLLVTGETTGRFTRVNPAWERTLGHSAETLYSTNFIHFVHPEDRAATEAEMEKLFAEEREMVGFRNRCRTADGDYRWLEWNAAARDGVVHAVARDVTAQREAEDQLANNAKSLEAMIVERTRELDDARAETLRQLALAAEYRDDETYQHTERVGHVAARIALGLELPAGQVTLLRQAAPLHDVGKLAIPDRILLKPGKLTRAEYEVMKTHAELGSRLLSSGSSPVLQTAAVIAATHHERWDGAGYPKGLAREEIPLVGRIVAVADVFDALIHDRPYKAAWPLELALEEIAHGSGTQFDPRVVVAFMLLRNDLGRLRDELGEVEQRGLAVGADGRPSHSIPRRRGGYLEHVDRHAPRAEPAIRRRAR
ncbi:MAG TPA: HD domain-containing phosphohydrolase [Solirubrobacteraceae bacterium]|jgi:PAS domain S-box-containing protein|nr:HD domain-containing phosphohydrolase [Solirubrobacteraceae bacterium]